MFTDRFIKVPVKVYDQEQKELTGNSETIETYRKINPLEIIEYGPTDDDNNGEFIYTNIQMKSGHIFCVYVSIDEFEKLLNNYNK